jgi:hypothetical protein
MLTAFVVLYLSVYTCAFIAATRGWTWLWYAVAVLIVPLLVSGLFYLVYQHTGGEAATELAYWLFGLGAVVALVAFPLNLMRVRRGR